MKRGEIYTYDSLYSTPNIIRIREVYFDTLYKRTSIKYDKIGSYFDDNKTYHQYFNDNNTYYHYEHMGIEIENILNFRRVSKRDWYRAIRQYNEKLSL